MERKDIGKRTTLDYKRLRNFQVFRFEGLPPFLSRLQDVPEATNKDGQVLLSKLKKVKYISTLSLFKIICLNDDNVLIYFMFHSLHTKSRFIQL